MDYSDREALRDVADALDFAAGRMAELVERLPTEGMGKPRAA
jgi:hypothetical protein